MFEKVKLGDLRVWLENGKLHFGYTLGEQEQIKAAGRISLGKTTTSATSKWSLKGDELVLAVGNTEGSLVINDVADAFAEMIK